MTLRDILDSKPHKIVTANQNHTVRDVINSMIEKNISCILIVDEHNKLVSIFTERDIVHCVVDNISFDEILKNVIRYDIIKFDPLVKISAVIPVALKKEIRHIPVVEGDTIVGMVTFRDLVSYLLPEICYLARQIY
jgi:CBS domain-containing protein